MADRRALVITTPGVIGLHEAAELIPGPGEVVARPVHTGICGTDLERSSARSAWPGAAAAWCWSG